MTTKQRYESAREIYKKLGVDTEAAIKKVLETSMALKVLHSYQEVFRQLVIIPVRQEHQRN
ncbi:MAG: hypothetical protein K0R05_164 [Anaerocolumna sp.]|nr:hypothetical protein [Anaerocolumna sp.]